MSAWTELRSLLEAKHAGYASILNPPATPDDLAVLEARLGLQLPESVRQVYENCNGQSVATPGVVLGMALLPIERVIDEMVSWLSVTAEDFGSEDFSSAPENAIKLEYANRRWLPLCDMGGGNYVGLDFDPGSSGTVGQVFNFGRDQLNKCVLASSLAQFLRDCVELVRKGEDLQFHANGLVEYRGHAFAETLINEKLGIRLEERSLDPGRASIWVSRTAVYPDGYFDVRTQAGLGSDFKVAEGGDFASNNFTNSDRSPLNMDLLFRLDSTLGACKASLRKCLTKLGVTEVFHLVILRDYDHAARHPTIAASEHAFFVGSFPSR